MKNYDTEHKVALYWTRKIYPTMCICDKEIAEHYFPELKDSEDERIRKEMIFYFTEEIPQCSIQEHADKMKEFIAWLKEQGTSYTKKDVDDAYVEGVAFAKDELKKQYEANYQTRKDIATFIFNYRGDIKDRAKWMDYLGIKASFVEKQGEQKPADKVEPKFHEGDWLCENEPNNYARFIQILETVNVQGKERYRISRDIHNDEDIVEFDFVEKYYHKFVIQDVKDGDVLATKKGNPFIYDKNRYNNGFAYYYAGLDVNKELTLKSPHHLIGHFGELRSVSPATKEQRDLLFAKMKEAGYEWDAEKKELKKIHVIDEGKAEMDYCFTKMMNGEKVTPAWSEKDEEIISMLIDLVEYKEESMEAKVEFIAWFKSLKERVQPQLKQEWKPSNELMQALERSADYLHDYGKNDDDLLLLRLLEELKKLREE